MTTVWRKSSYSANASECVELSTNTPTTLVRDSKNPGGPQLSFTRPELSSFLNRVKAAR